MITAEHIKLALEEHPGAEVIAHPECRSEVLQIADHVRSTSGMLNAALESSAMEFIVAMESGLLSPLANAAPGKHFFSPAEEPHCPNMKRTTLSKFRWALHTL